MTLDRQNAGLALSGALTLNDRTRPILSGVVASAHVAVAWSNLAPGEMFWRQLKFADFDISEMSLSSLAIATARGITDWCALPVFTSRAFFHTNILVHSGAGIETAADLRGRRVGVLEYQQTSLVWVRGFLEHEYGIRAADLEWFMERVPAQSHGGSTGFAPPPDVRLTYLPAATNMGQMILDGELDALPFYRAGLDLVDSPGVGLIDRPRIDLRGDPLVRRLYADGATEGHHYLKATGILPLNHCVVVRRQVADAHPWVVEAVFGIFQSANAVLARRRTELLGSYLETGVATAVVQEAVHTDPYAYGMQTTRRAIETLLMYLKEQGLTQRVLTAEEIFAPSMPAT